MDLRKLKTLIDLVSESNISELEITEADGKVRIVKADPHAAAPAYFAAAPMPRPAMAEVAQPAVAAEVAPVGHTVKSPMVGTFYRASSPGGKPLVDIGSDVTEGEAICIIEAMKIMNEITSEYEGRISKILVKNAQAVEYGQPLFSIAPGD